MEVIDEGKGNFMGTDAVIFDINDTDMGECSRFFKGLSKRRFLGKKSSCR